MEKFPTGRYCLLFSYDSSFVGDRISIQPFLVTGLAVLHAEDRVYVVNRSSGLPTPHATVQASFTVERSNGKIKFKDTVQHILTTNEKGYVVLPKEEAYQLQIQYKGDTLVETADVTKDEVSDDVYSKEDYDERIDFYDEKTTVEIFTDRSIYRPGQQVHFKALFITKDFRTGTDQIMNKAHLKKGFQNWLKKWVKEMEPELLLHDPFGRIIDSIKINPDEYGTVSGTFTIPLKGATGQWQIEPDYLDLGRNRGSFQVEEYKRPTFEITVDRPTKTFSIEDTIWFALNLHSFSGGGLSNTPVNYTVERSSIEQRYSGHYSESINILAGTTYTDEKGKVAIKILDTALRKIDKEQNIVFTYRLKASATDVAGETQEIKTFLKVATRPVIINIPLASTYNPHDLRPLLITTSDVNGLEVPKVVQVQLLKVSKIGKTYESDFSLYADQWIHTPQELSGWFETIKFQSAEEWEEANMIKQMPLSTANAEKFRWPLDSMTAGRYRIVVTAVEDGVEIGRAEKMITLFEPGPAGLPNTKPFFFYLPANYVFKGDTLILFSGANIDTAFTILHLKYYAEQKGKTIIQNTYIEQVQVKGIHSWKWKLPNNIRDRLLISEIGVSDNNVFHESEEVDIAVRRNPSQVIIEQFRNTLAPGATATYAVAVKTKDQPLAAQLMTTIYDASLDRLKEHRWQIPYPERSPYLKSEWTRQISDKVSPWVSGPKRTEISTIQQPIWWMTTGLSGGAQSVSLERLSTDNPLLALQGRMPGLMITNATGMDNISLTTAYATETVRFNTGNIVRVKIQGLNSINLDNYKQPLIILDGVPYTGSLGSINVKEITEIMVLKDADATAIYGSRGAAGVLLISTKGEIKLPTIKQEPIVKVRSNFNETAFFAPSILVDKEGYYKFTFTIPQSVTEWNWKSLAHTKAMEFAYAERKIFTQLPLMLQPNMPTMLYQGDRIVLKSRISNRDTVTLTGHSLCKIEDAVTGEDLTSQIISKPAATSFSVNAQSKTVATVELKVPDTIFHPLKIILTVKTKEMADGEEHIIPVLSRKLLVVNNQPITWRRNDTTVSKPASISSLYGIALSLPPKPQTALLSSLPFLANYSFDCAEQLYNKMYAHVIALNLVRNDSLLRTIYHYATEIQKDEEVANGNAVTQQTMPWLDLQTKSQKDQRETLELLDTLKSKRKIHEYLEKIAALQNEDGGLSWFPEGKTDPYISLYVLERFGKTLRNENWIPAANEYVGHQTFEEFIKKLLFYCDQQWGQPDKKTELHFLEYCYARGFWKSTYPINELIALKINDELKQCWQQEMFTNLKDRALLCITSLQYFTKQETLYRKAIDALHSLKQQAINDDKNGIRWKELADSDVIGTSTEETLACLLEAYEAAGEAATIEPGVIHWLLTNKQDHQWQTTTGTAAIISALRKTKGSVTDPTVSIKGTLLDTIVQVTDGLLAGKRFLFHPIKNLSSLTLQKLSNEPVTINIGWYHFTDAGATSSSNGLRIDKQIEHKIGSSSSWKVVTDTTQLKIGEKVRITLTIETDKVLRYVFIKDRKGAALEPVAYSSGNRWGGDFSYYESTRDTGREFFATSIPSGHTEIHYEMYVTQEGRFSSGMASLQCMYHPEVSAYSNNQQIEVRE